MARILPDGSCVPAHLGVSSTQERQAVSSNVAINNNLLRRGYICARHYPGEEGFINENEIVYEVLLYQNNGNKGEVGTRMPNVRAMVPFGSSADFYHASLRSPKNFGGSVITDELIATSTRVLVLCINGYSSQGIIVGCLPNYYDAGEKKEDGHNLYESFNGIKRIINKDGEYIIVHTGQTIDATTNKEEPFDPNKAGSFFKINKDGSVILDDNAGASITIDKTQHDIAVTAAGKTFIGSTSADEPLVLGLQLLDAFTELLDLTTKFANSPAIPGVPVGVNALPDIIAWQTKWQTTLNTSLLLAQDKFTERETT